MNSTKPVCQSCGVPILKDYDKGREMNGNLSEVYCRRCYSSGGFTEPEMTIEAMHEIIRSKMIDLKFPRFLAKLMANRVYTLKRWEVLKN